MADDVNYFLCIEKEALWLEVDVNGVPVETREDEKYLAKNRDVNVWMRPGRNTLRVKLNAGAGAPRAADKGACNVRIEKNPRPSDNAPIARLVWPAKGQPVAYPAQLSLTFDAPDAPITELWARGAKVGLTDENRRSLESLVASLMSAFVNKNIPKLGELLDFKALEMGRALYMRDSVARKSQLDFFNSVTSDSDWDIQPATFSSLQLNFVCEEKLIWITRQKRQPLVESKSGFAMHVYVALIDDQWLVAR